MGILLSIFVVTVVERLVTGKELLSDLEDFRQERLVPLIEELKARNVAVVLSELPSGGGETGFAPIDPYRTFESLANLQLTAHEVDFVHIGYWVGTRLNTECFYLDFVVECEIEEEARLDAELSLMRRFVLFGKRMPKWRGGALAHSLNQDEMLRKALPEVSRIMELLALWIVPNAERKFVRIHVPYVKKVDPQQFPGVLAVAARIAYHLKSLA
jgi:hypothetical protein